jgi:hypothetical protein
MRHTKTGAIDGAGNECQPLLLIEALLLSGFLDERSGKDADKDDDRDSGDHSQSASN